ncbi:MAG TPA: sorbosone dehydrogenase family protein [Thermoanaerobaculia bacterium]|nr:sorbosone dehydrogenase family protein [Thermoanaerobaculia bacterium]
MKPRFILSTALAIAVSLSCSPAGSQGRKDLPLNEIRLPPGFAIEVYVDNVPNARQMALSPDGTLYVGSRSEGKVYAIPAEKTKDKKVHTIASGLTMPSGLAFRDGSLYVAATSKVLRYDGIDGKLQNPPEPVVVSDDFPTERHHGWKFIAFGPDGWLYVPVGAPCNVCNEEKERPIFATITRMKPDGSGREIFASGVRNTVGFDWHPGTKELWFTENGRDMMGNDRPPDELNHAPKKGLHFGFPYCHGKDVKDPEFGSKPCNQLTPPARELDPHVAAIGMRFYTGSMFPAEYRNRILFAEHGSWNRDTPIGYRVMMVRLEGNKAVSYEPLAQGWLRKDGKAWGRPADVLVMPDGSLLVSDDEAGVIYRITYRKA